MNFDFKPQKMSAKAIVGLYPKYFTNLLSYHISKYSGHDDHCYSNGCKPSEFLRNSNSDCCCD